MSCWRWLRESRAAGQGRTLDHTHEVRFGTKLASVRKDFRDIRDRPVASDRMYITSNAALQMALSLCTGWVLLRLVLVVALMNVFLGHTFGSERWSIESSERDKVYHRKHRARTFLHWRGVV